MIDLFRTFGSSEGHGSVAAMDGLEAELTRLIGPEASRATVSDSLLFGFALRRKRETPLDFRPLHSRWGSADEFCLMTLISAADGAHDDLALEAGRALGIAGEGPLMSLAHDICASLKSLPFKTAFLTKDTFEAVMGSRVILSEAERAAFASGYNRFHFSP
ncbi:hypothetical protein [Microvirga pudoricolor]|uniref:hypothetical protein n=1 Tax=Microvirga pudoricolor TaxID=2778729 RepID=UPI001950834F|nr:hypothetical protein [Microvirga pudoricolor]MBM6592570.1 hypothetical protein [Microvirga pudoricolor]